MSLFPLLILLHILPIQLYAPPTAHSTPKLSIFRAHLLPYYITAFGVAGDTLDDDLGRLEDCTG